MAVNNTRTNQGGSVASFVVGAVILVLLLAGGIYFLQKRTHSPTPTPSTSTNTTSKTTSASPSVTVPSKSPSASSSPSTSTPQPSRVPQPNSTASNPNVDTALPATGPEDTYASLLAITLLTITVISYVQSRRILARQNSRVD